MRRSPVVILIVITALFALLGHLHVGTGSTVCATSCVVPTSHDKSARVSSPCTVCDILHGLAVTQADEAPTPAPPELVAPVAPPAVFPQQSSLVRPHDPRAPPSD